LLSIVSYNGSLGALYLLTAHTVTIDFAQISQSYHGLIVYENDEMEIIQPYLWMKRTGITMTRPKRRCSVLRVQRRRQRRNRRLLMSGRRTTVGIGPIPLRHEMNLRLHGAPRDEWKVEYS
jgi:hypothetical protein